MNGYLIPLGQTNGYLVPLGQTNGYLIPLGQKNVSRFGVAHTLFRLCCTTSGRKISNLGGSWETTEGIKAPQPPTSSSKTRRLKWYQFLVIARDFLDLNIDEIFVGFEWMKRNLLVGYYERKFMCILWVHGIVYVVT